MLDMNRFWESLSQAAQEMGGEVVKTSMQIADGRKRWPGTIHSATIKTPERLVRMHKVDCYGWCTVVAN
jgi:hypothetical protein